MEGSLFGATKPVGQFLNRYIVCEAIARKLIVDKAGKHCPNTLYLSQIQSAVRWFKLAHQIDSQLVEQIFHSSKKHQAVKTPRQLRNAIVHGIAVNDCSEVNRRYAALMSLMQQWLNAFITHN